MTCLGLENDKEGDAEIQKEEEYRTGNMAMTEDMIGESTTGLQNRRWGVLF